MIGLWWAIACSGGQGSPALPASSSPSMPPTGATGHTGTACPDEVPLDGVFVVDGSPAADAAREALAASVGPMVEALLDRGVDFHLGVTSPFPLDPLAYGRLVEVDGRRWVDPATPEPAEALAALVRAGGGMGSHQARGAAWLALLPSTPGNQGFRRPVGSVAVLGSSIAEDTTPASVITWNEFRAGIAQIDDGCGRAVVGTWCDPTACVGWTDAALASGGPVGDVADPDGEALLLAWIDAVR